MALAILSHGLIAPKYQKCTRKGSEELHPRHTFIQDWASVFDALIGITLFVIGILSVEGTIPLHSGEICAMFCVGTFEIANWLGARIDCLNHRLLHAHGKSKKRTRPRASP